MNYTENYHLQMPQESDYAAPESNNAAAIDAALHALATGKLDAAGDGAALKPVYEEAAARTNIYSGLTLGVTLGRIKKFLADLKAVAFTGSYTDLANKPSIPSSAEISQAAGGTVNAHNTAGDAHSSLFAGKASASALTDHTGNRSNPHGVTKAQVGLGNVDNTSDASKPISTATQTALNGKAAASHTHAPADLTAAVPVSKGGTGATAAAAARTNLGAAARIQWTNINVPTTAWAQNSTDKYYYATVSVSGMLATDNPHSVDIVRSNDAAADALCDEAFGMVDRIVTQAGSIKLRAPDGKPTVAFKLWMEATR